MAFTFVRNLASNHSPVAAPKDVTSYKIAGSDSVSMGDALMFDGNGDVTLATTDEEEIAVIALEDGEGDDDDEIRVQWVLPGHVYKCPSTSVDDTVVGNTYQLEDSDGLNQASENGPLTVVGKDSDGNYVLVAFNSGLLYPSTKPS